MYTTDTTNVQTCWRCRKCGVTTPLGQDTCSNPSCRADLSLYGEPFTPTVKQKPGREEKTETPPQKDDSKHQSSSNLWTEESTTETTKGEKRKAKGENRGTESLSRKEKKALKKQQAEACAQEAAARRNLYNRGPVKTFFLSVLIILVSLLAGILAGGLMLMSFTYWGDLFYWDFGRIYYPNALLWHQILPGVLLIVLSAIFARIVLKEKGARKLMYTTIGFWMIPFVISCWRRFTHDGGDSYELLSVYLFFLFNLEPVLVGSTFAGIKGLKKASSILRWIGILMLVATGVMAVILTINRYFMVL